MIEHAWTVVCDRARVDQDTGNVSLDTIDQLGFDERLREGICVVPFPLHIVSLWYRADASAPETARMNINFRGPLGENIAQFPIDLSFTQNRRLRTRHLLRNLMIVGVGVHQFVIELMQGGQLTQVAKIPFEITRRTLEDLDPVDPVDP